MLVRQATAALRLLIGRLSQPRLYPTVNPQSCRTKEGFWAVAAHIVLMGRRALENVAVDRLTENIGDYPHHKDQIEKFCLPISRSAQSDSAVWRAAGGSPPRQPGDAGQQSGRHRHRAALEAPPPQKASPAHNRRRCSVEVPRLDLERVDMEVRDIYVARRHHRLWVVTWIGPAAVFSSVSTTER